ncbi:hypothetical protein AAT19DRAFT_11259 [Rhodotorula toruloides]|uniref:F-box domain-containing protein n=1 Tax=Rhodotorula toruloides TaxID=5286 RepID=A0A2S9ZXM4_RHOTO|nr:hypothetical protein AAT19DRAFT_11259 [Rhodotorula toruloides]
MDSEGHAMAEQTSLDSTPSNASLSADYLTNLPTELFSTVCELVHRSQRGPYLGMISRRFLPFARRLVFDTVDCRSIARIRCLHRALETCPELRSAVRKLVFGRSYSRADDFGEEVPPIPILLACLDHVRVLRIYSGARTAVSCVLQQHTTSVLPLLQRIELHGCLDEEQRVHLVDTLGALQQYPTSTNLRAASSAASQRFPVTAQSLPSQSRQWRLSRQSPSTIPKHSHGSQESHG